LHIRIHGFFSLSRSRFAEAIACPLMIKIDTNIFLDRAQLRER